MQGAEVVITPEDRKVIFGTASIEGQMKKLIIRRGEAGCTIDELRQVFPEISIAFFMTTINVLRSKGIVMQEGDILHASADLLTEEGLASDCVWRAARLLKEFTAADVRELVPNLRARTISDILRDLAKAGAIKVCGRGAYHSFRYRLIHDSPVRPRRERDIHAGKSKANLIWEAIRSMPGDFTSIDVIAKTGLEPSYVRDILRQWTKLGAVERTRKAASGGRIPARYVVVSDTRPPIRKNAGF